MSYTINEQLSDSEWTAPINVPAVFGTARRIESITIHHWGNFGQTHYGVVDFFVNRNPNTSAHFVVSDGLIHCLVSPANAAWAAGNAYGNATSIHIECRPEATDGDYRTVAWLVAFLRKNYGENLPLIRHSQWSPTACPGQWDLTRLDKLARAQTSTPAPAPAPKKELFMALTQADENLIRDRSKAYVDAPISKVDDAVWGTLIKRTSGNVSALQELADCKTLLLSQKSVLAGLLNAIQQLSKAQGQPVDLEAIKAAAEAGASDALADLNAVVTFEKAGAPILNG